MNLPVERLFMLLLILIGCAVVILIQIVGIILVIALLTIPSAISRQFTGSVLNMMVFSVFLGAVFTTSGIIISFIADIPSGATIILTSAAAYGCVLGLKALKKSVYMP
jgi:zinc transport system permease protein